MGNRGTTPSWDDEQIAKFGLDLHLRTGRRLHRPAPEVPDLQDTGEKDTEPAKEPKKMEKK